MTLAADGRRPESCAAASALAMCQTCSAERWMAAVMAKLVAVGAEATVAMMAATAGAAATAVATAAVTVVSTAHWWTY